MVGFKQNKYPQITSENITWNSYPVGSDSFEMRIKWNFQKNGRNTVKCSQFVTNLLPIDLSCSSKMGVRHKKMSKYHPNRHYLRVVKALYWNWSDFIFVYSLIRVNNLQDPEECVILLFGILESWRTDLQSKCTFTCIIIPFA